MRHCPVRPSSAPARGHALAAALALAAAAPLSGCPSDSFDPPLQITQVSYSQTVVLPGETIQIAAVVEGADDVNYAWTADAGTFSAPAAASTDWTAPELEQLVAVHLDVSASGDRAASHEVDILVGVGLDHDGDGYSLREGDCDDTNEQIYPGSPDVADGLDNDCDGQVDEGSPEADDDGDGFSDLEGDCDDGTADVFPGAEEVQNGIDDDCDTLVDEGTDAYDDDGDGSSEEEGDCNDDSTAIHPGAPEILDGVDNDCDGDIDEGTAAWDDDGDGFSEINGDCDDSPATGASASPLMAEIPDGIDNDCDGEIDEDFTVDEDGDGWSPLAGDCDDGNFHVFPGAPEFADGIDNDCDSLVDEDMDDNDDDGDGFSEADGDCDDTLPEVYPGAEEVPDGIIEWDNDCDGWFFTNPPFAVGSLGSISGCTNLNDDDGDGWVDAEDPDCIMGFVESGTGFTQCNDGADNDFDGYVDSADPQCGSGIDGSEASSSQDDCEDGGDNDGDGWVDAEDPDCWVQPFNESIPGLAACNDAIDNDGDGLVDSADPDCDDGFDGSESDANPDDCADGTDNDGDGWVDGEDPDCLEPPYDESGVGTAVCNDGIDNDGDGFEDGLDAGCGSALDSDEMTSTCSGVVLDGTPSWDPDEGDSLSYYWYFAWQPINSELSSNDIAGGSTALAIFTPDVPGTWVLGLYVSDGLYNSEPLFLTVDVVDGGCP